MPAYSDEWLLPGQYHNPLIELLPGLLVRDPGVKLDNCVRDERPQV